MLITSSAVMKMRVLCRCRGKVTGRLRLKALADPVRVRLVSLLFSSAVGEECSCDLAAAVGLSESTVSHHLSQLRRAGLVESERQGMKCLSPPPT